MSGYIEYPIETDPTTLLDEAYANLQDKVPQWQPNPNNLDTWILQITASQASDLMTLAQDVPDTIFKWYGANLINMPPLNATSALVGSKWTVQDTAGYLIPAGTQVAIRDGVGVQHAFVTLLDTVIPAGQSSLDGVTLSSVEQGSALSNLGGVGYVCTLIDTLSYVVSVTLDAATAGGQDAELSSDYNSRLSRKLQRLSQRPILGSDFSLAALDVTGVYRAVSLDGYNPADGSFNNQRMVGTAAVDQNGAPISSAIVTNLQTYLQSLREVNFVVNVFNPTVTQIDVTFNVKCLTGYAASVVQSNATSRVQAYLDPSVWGKDPTITDTLAAEQSWVETPVVYYNKLLQVLGQAGGVDRVLSMTFGIHSGALGTADVTLPGHACLAQAATITGTATP